MHVIVYDRTQGWLTASWWAGAAFRSLRKGRDEIIPVSSWDEMVDGLKRLPPGSVEQLDYWGHGLSSTAFCNKVQLPIDTLGEVRTIMSSSNALWWWRTCSSFWGKPGRDFARRCVDSLGCRVAGFQYDIWLWQSGLQVAGPLDPPDWGNDGGKWSWPWRPRTVSCFSGSVEL